MASASELTCPVCDTELADDLPACAKCGFPASLREEASRALQERDPFERATAGHRAPRPRLTARPPSGRSQGAAGAVADELVRSFTLIRRLGIDPGPMEGEMRRAALAEIHGRADEAVRILAALRVQANETMESTFDRRVRQLEVLTAAVSKDTRAGGLRSALKSILRSLEAGRYEEALDALLSAEGDLTGVVLGAESLRAPLKEIDELLASLHLAGVEAPELLARAEALRSSLVRPSAGSVPDLSKLTEQVDALRAELQRRIPESIQAQLTSHAETLRPFPDDHPEATSARAIHAEAIEHLEAASQIRQATELIRARRLDEASETMNQLMALLDRAQAVPPRSVTP